jgi:cysteinyl-tRNA synthetase
MIRFFNSLTRSLEEFVPIKEGEVSIYTCGPTVYNTPHIGNLRTFIFEDLLHRWMEYRGYTVHHVMNLTDVDDKTIRNSILKNMSLSDYTDIYKKEFFDSIKQLNFKPAEAYPSATEYVPGMIEMIKGLIKKGYAYESSDGVYFKVSAFKDYGKLAHIDREALLAGASGRTHSDEYSRDEISDFALWKKWSSEDGDVMWPSPFGDGRPGWHIECSVMSMKLLGNTIDIHCGGIDNMFPHHENEIAQSEAFTGVKFVNYWLHAMHLQVDSEKMSKSKNNFYTLADLAERGHNGRAVRYALLSAHYRKPLNFTFDLLKQAESSLKRIDEFVFELGKVSAEGRGNPSFSKALKSSAELFDNALDSDLNISEALSALFTLISFYNNNKSGATRKNADDIKAWLDSIDSVLGFIRPAGEDGGISAGAEAISPEAEELIKQRTIAKENKDYKKADEIRAKLLESGIEVRDTKDGAVWKKIGS